jgi:hypothetical protein
MRRLCAVLAIAFSASAAAFAGDVRILTDPEGAEVAQGSIHLGVTTKEGLRIVGVEPGMVTFTISKPGFETGTRVISVESLTEPMTVLVRLLPAQVRETTQATPTSPEPAASPTPSPVTPKTAGAPETAPAPKPKGGSKTARIILGGAAGFVGGVALAVAINSGATASPTPTTLPPRASLANLSATVTSPQEGAVLNCNQPAFVTVSLTNTAPALVFVSGVRRHQTSVAGTCGSVPDFTYPVVDSLVGTGSADVLHNQVLFNGTVGCCEPPGGCGGSCNVQFSFTVVTSVGEVNAGLIDYGIVFNGCALCTSFAGFNGAGCPAKP